MICNTRHYEMLITVIMNNEHQYQLYGDMTLRSISTNTQLLILSFVTIILSPLQSSQVVT